MGSVADFIFLGSKITADGDCNHEIKRCLLLGRKVMTNLDSIFKSRDITLPTKEKSQFFILPLKTDSVHYKHVTKPRPNLRGGNYTRA